MPIRLYPYPRNGKQLVAIAAVTAMPINRGFTMILPFRVLMFLVALVTGVVTSYSVFAQGADVFDRLDGSGPSKVRVDVIEWDGNLEVHVYPRGALKGLSAKLDDRESGKKVMVIGYRLGNSKTPLIRRAILGIPFTKNVLGFIDRTEPDFDKFALSNQPLSKPWAPFKLDPAPAQWGPEGSDKAESSQPRLTEQPSRTESDSSRAPASVPQPHRSHSRGHSDHGNSGSLNQFNW